MDTSGGGGRIQEMTNKEEKAYCAESLPSLIVSYFFAFLGSVVLSRGSKKVLVWRTVPEQ